MRELTEIEIEEIAAGYDWKGLAGAITVGAGVGGLAGACAGPGGFGMGALGGGLMGGMTYAGNGAWEAYC